MTSFSSELKHTGKYVNGKLTTKCFFRKRILRKQLVIKKISHNRSSVLENDNTDHNIKKVKYKYTMTYEIRKNSLPIERIRYTSRIYTKTGKCIISGVGTVT